MENLLGDVVQKAIKKIKSKLEEVFSPYRELMWTPS
jgi:hypothetical protein